ncbi:MAG: alpha/beta fold hydrolase [Deltaproteobacteria bacterium]|nr:alpha/beta fold hydrolase [Deltaproteobacteria bacterium]
MEHRTLDNWSFYAGAWPLDPTRPTLVFIHGAGLSGRFWGNQMDGLASLVNTLSLDLPGHGQAPGPFLESIGDMAGSVSGFLKRLTPPRPIPVGLSMGGAIVQRLLLDQPGRFEAAILANTGAKLGVMPTILDVLKTDFAKYLDLSVPFLVSKKTPPERFRATMEDVAAQDPDATYADLVACNQFDVRKELGAVDTPVLVMTASDDLMTPPKYGDFLKAAIPGARMAQVAGAGHLSPVEKPDEFNRAVADFLDERGL